VSHACAECGAPLSDGESCIDRFHAMLGLENEFITSLAADGDRGKVAHFHAVSSYALQHPEGMQYTREAIEGLRRNVADQLAGRATLPDLLARVRRGSNGARRVARREDDEVPGWPVRAWPLTVAHLLAGGAPGYDVRAAGWARSVIEAIDAAGGVLS
jgi:hypothetical protein